jgi:hypothetical protein
VGYGSVAWGDYDGDGDLDILLTGRDNASQLVARVYRNDPSGGGRVFVDIGASLLGVEYSSAVWGDYDNDGDLDILLSGWDGFRANSKIYRNEGGGTFLDSGFYLPGTSYSVAAWGDYDSDGNLDFILSGSIGPYGATPIYQLDGLSPNTVPTAPSGLSASTAGNQVTLSWKAATDSKTPTNGLSYNLRVGTTPGGNQISSAMSAATGHRLVAQLGNTQQDTSRVITLAEVQTLYWSVQAVDGAFAGGAFAAEKTVIAYTITISQVGSGSIVGSRGVWPGQSTCFTITPAAGYHLDSLYVDGAPVAPASGYCFNNVTGNHTLRAWFGFNGLAATLYSPQSEFMIAGATTGSIVCRARIDGLTSGLAADPGLEVQLGYGPHGSEPATAGGWTWEPAAWDANIDGAGQYSTPLTMSTPGLYDYCFRARYTPESDTWLYADLDGSANGYLPAQAGDMVVVGPTASQVRSDWCARWHSAATRSTSAVSSTRCGRRALVAAACRWM